MLWDYSYNFNIVLSNYGVSIMHFVFIIVLRNFVFFRFMEIEIINSGWDFVKKDINHDA
jgi:hypothetical protein